MPNWTKDTTLNAGSNSTYRVTIEGELDGYGNIPNDASLVHVVAVVKLDDDNAVRGGKWLSETGLSAGEKSAGKTFVEALLSELMIDKGFSEI